MKQTISFILIFSYYTLQSQNVLIPFYDYFNLQIAEYYFDAKKYDAALFFYDKATNLSPNYLLAEDYVKAAKSAYLIKKNKKCKTYLKKAIENGVSETIIKEDSLLNVCIKHYKINISEYYVKYKSKLDLDICNKIEYLYNLDQQIREQEENTNYNTIDVICRNKYFNITDSIYIFEQLNILLGEHKLTKEQIANNQEKLTVLLRHQTYYPKNYAKLDTFVKTLVLNKVLQPAHYAFIYDGYFIAKSDQGLNGEQFYGTQFTKYFPKIEFQKFFLEKDLDTRRIKIGLIPLNLKYKNRANFPKNYKGNFEDIDIFIKYINKKCYDFNYIFRQ